MKLFVLILLAFTVSTSGLSQTYNGMFGKKNILQLEGDFCIPLLSNIYDETEYNSYQKKGNRLVNKKDNFDAKGQVSLIHYFGKGFGLGISVGYGTFSLAQPEAYYTDYAGDFYRINHELIDVSQLQIMPRIEIGSTVGLLPIGIGHQIGLGYSRYTLLDKEYAVSDAFNNNVIFTTGNSEREYYDFKRNGLFHGFTFLYGVTMRLPISKRVLFIYNIQYTLNLVGLESPIDGYNDNYNEKYIITKSMQSTILRNDQLKSIIKMGAGFAFTF